jgi:hypothetical protein
MVPAAVSQGDRGTDGVLVAITIFVRLSCIDQTPAGFLAMLADRYSAVSCSLSDSKHMQS